MSKASRIAERANANLLQLKPSSAGYYIVRGFETSATSDGLDVAYWTGQHWLLIGWVCREAHSSDIMVLRALSLLD